MTTYRDWSASAPGVETLGLWATPAERSEWRTVLELTRGHQPVLLTTIEGSAPLAPRFAPPVASYFCPGLTLPVEARRKASQLSTARMIVPWSLPTGGDSPCGPNSRPRWTDASSCYEGETFRVYRRVRPPSARESRGDSEAMSRTRRHAAAAAVFVLRPSTAERR